MPLLSRPVRRLVPALVLGALVSVGIVAPAEAASTVTTVIPVGAGAGPRGVVVDSEGGRAYVGNSGRNTVAVIDVATRTMIKEISIGPATGIGAFGLAFDSVTDQVYASDYQRGTVAVIDTSTSSLKTVIPHDPTLGIGSGPQGVSVDSELGRAYVVNSGADSVSVIDTARNVVTGVMRGMPQPTAIAMDTALHKSYVASDTRGVVSVIDTATNTLLTTIRSAPGGIGTHPVAIAVDSINQRAYVVDEGDRSVTVINTRTDAVDYRIEGIGTAGSLLSAVAVDPASQLIFVTDSGDSGLSIFSAVTGALVRNIPRDLSGGPAIKKAPRGVAFDASTSQAFVCNWQDASVSVVDVDEGPATVGVERVAGADRFEVSAKASEGVFERGVKVAYVASGLNFPDALSGAAAAEGRGPVLLVKPDEIPSVVERELARLRPDRIVVLGGTASVGAPVEAALATYAPRVERIAGAERYTVSAAISRNTFPVGPNVAYIASGQGYADALSGSAVAGVRRGPVLLVQKDAIPDPIAAELARLRPASIVVLGGAESVSDSVLTTLGATAPTTRIGGADRYEVASAVSKSAFLPDTPTVYVASGRVFSDALSGSAAAIPSGAPMLIVTGTSVPAPVASELTRLRPTRIVVLGGAASVSDEVVEQLKTYLRT
jgi:YVTN family beta-propeller protein